MDAKRKADGLFVFLSPSAFYLHLKIFGRTTRFSGRADAHLRHKRKYPNLAIVWLIALAAWIPDVVKSTTTVTLLCLCRDSADFDSQIPVLPRSSCSPTPILSMPPLLSLSNRSMTSTA